MSTRTKGLHCLFTRKIIHNETASSISHYHHHYLLAKAISLKCLQAETTRTLCKTPRRVIDFRAHNLALCTLYLCVMLVLWICVLNCLICVACAQNSDECKYTYREPLRSESRALRTNDRNHKSAQTRNVALLRCGECSSSLLDSPTVDDEARYRVRVQIHGVYG